MRVELYRRVLEMTTSEELFDKSLMSRTIVTQGSR